jgi:hypothetical protein
MDENSRKILEKKGYTSSNEGQSQCKTIEVAKVDIQGNSSNPSACAAASEETCTDVSEAFANPSACAAASNTDVSEAFAHASACAGVASVQCQMNENAESTPVLFVVSEDNVQLVQMSSNLNEKEGAFDSEKTSCFPKRKQASKKHDLASRLKAAEQEVVALREMCLRALAPKSDKTFKVPGVLLSEPFANLKKQEPLLKENLFENAGSNSFDFCHFIMTVIGDMIVTCKMKANT